MREELLSFYEEVGGEPVFAKLAHEFYQGVAKDPVLKPMYPEDDLGPAEERLKLFLEQYWAAPAPIAIPAATHVYACVTCPTRSTLMHEIAGSATWNMPWTNFTYLRCSAKHSWNTSNVLPTP